MNRKHRTQLMKLTTHVPSDTKNALDRILFLLDMSEDEALREALYLHLPNLMQRAQIVMEGRKLPSIV